MTREKKRFMTTAVGYLNGIYRKVYGTSMFDNRSDSKLLIRLDTGIDLEYTVIRPSNGRGNVIHSTVKVSWDGSKITTGLAIPSSCVFTIKRSKVCYDRIRYKYHRTVRRNDGYCISDAYANRLLDDLNLAYTKGVI